MMKDSQWQWAKGTLSEWVKATSAKYTLEDLEFKHSPKHTVGEKTHSSLRNYFNVSHMHLLSKKI